MQPVSLGQNLSRGHSSFENEEVSSTRTGKAAIPLVSHAFTSSSLFSTSSSETGYTAAKKPFCLDLYAPEHTGLITITAQLVKLRDQVKLVAGSSRL